MLKEILKAGLIALGLFVAFDLYAQEPQGQKDYKTHLYVIFDDSGSMQGPRIEKAREAIKKITDAIEAKHDVMGISKAVIIPMNASAYGRSNYDSRGFSSRPEYPSLSEYVSKIEATGGTDIAGPTQKVQRNEIESDAANIIVLAFTDGEVDVRSTVDSVRNLIKDSQFRDIQFQLVKVSDSAPSAQQLFQYGGDFGSGGSGDLVKALNDLNEEYKKTNPSSPVVRTVKAEELKDFSGLDATIAELTKRILSSGIRHKVKELYGKDKDIDKESDNLTHTLTQAESSLKAVDSVEDRLTKDIKSASEFISHAVDGMDKMTLSEALAAYMEAVQKVRGFHNNSLFQQLAEFDRLTRQLKSIEDTATGSHGRISDLRKKLEQLKTAAEDMKKSHPKEYESLPQEVKDWLASQSEKLQGQIDTVSQQAEALRNKASSTRERVGKVQSSFNSQFATLQKTELDRYRDAFVARFGKEKWDELMKAGAKSGMYYDPKTKEWVLTGLHYSGGGNGSSRGSSSSHDGIKLRNEGTIIELPGGGGGGGVPVTQFTNNGTIIKSGLGIDRLNVEGNGGFTLFLNNGDIIYLSPENIHSRGEFTWVRFEKGFLIFKRDSAGNILQTIYVTDKDLLQVANELEGTASHEEIVRKMVKNDLSCGAEAGKVAVAGVVDTFESMSRAARKYVLEEKEGEKAPEKVWDYSSTSAQAQRLKEKCAAEKKELEAMLDSSSKHLSKFPKEFWQTMLTIMVGPEEAEAIAKQDILPGENTPTVGTTGKIVHSGVAAAEAAAAYRLTLHNTVNRLRGVRPTATGNSSFAKRTAGKLLRWGAGAALMYDAGKRAYMVWALDVDPTWSPLITSAVPSDLVEAVKRHTAHQFDPKNGPLSKNPEPAPPSPKAKRQLKVEEFFKALDDE